jgi:hypothetical protein
MEHDIVYILKSGVCPDEITYSLRSVCKNFLFRKIWFFGGKPDGIEPDEYVFGDQRGTESWRKVNSTIEQVCKTKDVSEDFWLFNDDFFIMKRIEDLPPIYNGTLLSRVEEIRSRQDGMVSLYATRLLRAKTLLEEDSFATFNYAVHMPMLINKKKAFETIKHFRKSAMFRSLYGNMWEVGGINRPDVKIFNVDEAPDPESDMLSTSDLSFQEGLVGEFIRSRFPEPCRYEKG